ncbi:hypothetical protein [Cobetia marina]|uniref:hypothetical protein n=1 Tax=Cobetia marina TaxID=28258 RepID=UPI0011436480|nr:hypothetical protein [Cobetia marina]GED41226.1 hypothetical protein HHA02_05550 [Cobetia marina]
MNASIDLSKVLDWLPNAKLGNVIATAIVSTPIVYFSINYPLSGELIYASASIIVLSSLASALSIGSLIGRALTYCIETQGMKRTQRKKSRREAELYNELCEKYYKEFDFLGKPERNILRALVQSTLAHRAYRLDTLHIPTAIDMEGYFRKLETDNLLHRVSPIGAYTTLYMADKPLIEYFNQQSSD